MARIGYQKSTERVTANFLADVVKDAVVLGPLDQPYSCKYCHKKFQKEKTLYTHVCQTKYRLEAQHEPEHRMGYIAWQYVNQRMKLGFSDDSYESFIRNSLYLVFIKFGKFIVSSRISNMVKYIDWLVSNNKKIDIWTNDVLYITFSLENNKSETPSDALERTIKEIDYYTRENGIELVDFFRKINGNRLCSMINSGRISPWVIYCSESGLEAISKLSQDQVTWVWKWIDPDFWQKRMRIKKVDSEWCKEILKDSGF